jgi:hypothetical protein
VTVRAVDVVELFVDVFVDVLVDVLVDVFVDVVVEPFAELVEADPLVVAATTGTSLVAAACGPLVEVW